MGSVHDFFFIARDPPSVSALTPWMQPFQETTTNPSRLGTTHPRMTRKKSEVVGMGSWAM